jgi:hypothetical protein
MTSDIECGTAATSADLAEILETLLTFGRAWKQGGKFSR